MAETSRVDFSNASPPRKRAEVALWESETRHEILVEAAQEGIGIVDPDENILFVNQAYANLLGYEKEELLGLNLSDLTDESEFAKYRTETQKRRQGKSSRYETTLRRKTGEIRHFSVSATPLYDGQGTFAGTLGLLIDITERKRAEEEITRLAKFPAEDPNPVLRIAGDGVILYGNKASRPLLKVWRRRQGEVLPNDWHRLVLDALRAGRSLQTELECEDRTFSLTFAPVMDWEYVNVYALDITEGKRTRRALELSHRFLEIANRHSEMKPLLEEFVAGSKVFTGCAAVGIRVVDQDGRIPYRAYDGFSRQFYESENDLSVAADRCMCINVIKDKTDPRLPFYTERGSFYINGTTRFLATVSEREKGRTRNVCNEMGYESVALIPIRLRGRILGLIHVADPRENVLPLETVEILEAAAMQLGTAIQRVRAEEALRAAHDELEVRVRQRTAELAEANDALKSEIAERKRLEKEVLRISSEEQQRIGQELHDQLGQQLLGLRMMAKSLQKTLQAKSLPEADSASQITEALIDAQGHVRAIIKGIYPVDVDANGLMAALADLAGSTEMLAGVPCTFVCDQPVPVEDNHTATQLFHIASEAVRNAVKHARAKHIAIGLGCEAGKLTLWVGDDGVGIRRGQDGVKGTGLRIMRYRAGVIGAVLDTRSPGDGGTLVTCTLPQDWQP